MTNRMSERRKQFLQDHVSDVMPCGRCRKPVPHIWVDGTAPGMIPQDHQCVQEYQVQVQPDAEAGTLFDISVA